MAIETILGALLGGVFRLAPAAIEHFDKKNERKHELDMLRENRESERIRLEMQHKGLVIEGNNTLDGKTLDVLAESIKGQGKGSGVKWVDALSASVRPVLTYWWCMGLYTMALGARFVMVYRANPDWVVAMDAIWGVDEKAIVANMLSFWFMGRVLDMMAKRRG